MRATNCLSSLTDLVTAFVFVDQQQLPSMRVLGIELLNEIIRVQKNNFLHICVLHIRIRNVFPITIQQQSRIASEETATSDNKGVMRSV